MFSKNINMNNNQFNKCFQNEHRSTHILNENGSIENESIIYIYFYLNKS